MKTLQDQIRLIERLDQLIRLKATGTPCELAKKINLSRRHTYRIINEMKNMGFPIEYCRTRQSFYYQVDVRFKFEVCALTEKEGKSTRGGKRNSIFPFLFSGNCNFSFEYDLEN